MGNIFENIRWIFYGNAWTETGSVNLGGPKCAAMLPLAFKVSINLISVAWHCWIINVGTKRLNKSLRNRKADLESCCEHPSYFETLYGYLGYLLLFITVINKVMAGQLVFMFNACHVCCLASSYVMVSKRTTMTCYVFNFMISSAAGVIMGVVFADLTGLDLPFEHEMFYLEHFLPIFGVLILFMSGRYKSGWFGGIEVALAGFAWYALYERVVCWGVSELTWANINYTLCQFDGDPFYQIFGMWYYLVCEVYQLLPSLLVRYVYLAIGYTIRKFLTISVMNTSMDDLMKSSLFVSQIPDTKSKTD